MNSLFALTSTLAAAPPHGDEGDHGSALSVGEPTTTLEAAAQTTLFVVVDIGIGALSIAFVMCLWRLLRGPTLADRGLAGDTIAMQVVGLSILLTIRIRTLMFFDAVLIISILGFASTLAFSQFIARRRAV